MRIGWRLALVLLPVFFATAAFPAVPAPPEDWQRYWEPVSSGSLPALSPDGELPSFRIALNRQIENCREFREGKFNHCANETLPVQLACDERVLQKLAELAKTSANWQSFYRKAKSAFQWLRYRTPKPAAVLFTGYNAPGFEGALSPDSKFRYPVYSRPADLVDFKDANGKIHWKKRLPDGSLVPYDTRRDIDGDGHSLAGKGLEVAYLEFPSDIFRLQIEGSGVLDVLGRDGSSRRYTLNYAGKNGHPYNSPFKLLKEKGVDPKYLTFPGLKQYFQDFPDEMWPTLLASPSYVFFSRGEEPPCGTARVHITAGHSLATDPSQLPLGSVVFFSAQRPVEGSDPNAPNAPTKPFTRFAFAQDTGGAIKGAHVDVYWGTGSYAELASNLMSGRGELYIPRMK